MTKPGDLVRIKAGRDFKGTYMPNSNKKTLFLKLESGYNVGIEHKKIKHIKLLKSHKESITKKEKIKLNKKLPTISILHTGGTIASKVDYKTGGTISRFEPEELLGMFPELRKICNIRSKLIGNMWSQDMRFSHYNIMAKEIQKEIKAGTDGIIITQGTDTLHYTSAALAFTLEDLGIPVLIVGAQRSSDRGSSDAGMNLICAAQFITKTNFGEVGVAMHLNMSDDYVAILPATKNRKLHTSRRDAFQPVNDTPIALINYKTKEIEFIKEDYVKKDLKRKLKLKLFNEKLKIGIIKQHTNMYAEQFLFYKNYDGLVIEATGLGCLPISENDTLTKESGKIYNALQTLVKNNVIVVEAPQTIFGRINLNVYSDQRMAQECGILGDGNDMTPATTFIKLAWLLSNYKKNEVKDLITKNLRGEITERSNVDEDS